MAHLSRKHTFVHAARWAMAGIIALTATAGPGFAQDRRRSELASSNPIVAATALERTIDEYMTGNPKSGAVFTAIREVFPLEYRQSVSSLVGKDPSDDKVFDAAFGPLAKVVEKHEAAMLEAPNANLVAMAEARLALLRAARGDSAALCSAIANDLDYTDMTSASRRTRAALTNYMVILSMAGKAGLEQPVHHKAIGDDDLAALSTTIVASGASQRVVDQIYGDRAAVNAKEDCAASITLYEAIARLPARQMAAIMLSMLRRAAEAGEGTDAENKVNAVLDESGLADPFRETLQRDFPEDYAAFRAEQAKLVEDGGDAEDADINLYHLVVALNAEHSAKIAQAGDGELIEVLRQRQEALRLFKGEDVRLCADFAERRDHDVADDVSTEAAVALIAAEAAYFRAIASGLRRPVSRPEPDKADVAALTSRLKRTGLGEDALMQLVGGEADDLAEGQRCDMAIALHDAMAAMPPRTSAALVARMMAKLAAPAPETGSPDGT